MKNYPLGIKQHSLTQFHFVLNTKLGKKNNTGSQFVLKPNAKYLLSSNKVQLYTCTLFYNNTKS